MGRHVEYKMFTEALMLSRREPVRSRGVLLFDDSAGIIHNERTRRNALG